MIQHFILCHVHTAQTNPSSTLLWHTQVSLLEPQASHHYPRHQLHRYCPGQPNTQSTCCVMRVFTVFVYTCISLAAYLRNTRALTRGAPVPWQKVEHKSWPLVTYWAAETICQLIIQPEELLRDPFQLLGQVVRQLSVEGFSVTTSAPKKSIIQGLFFRS